MLDEAKKRQQDFKKIFNSLLKKHHRNGKAPTLSAVITETIMSGAPSYYVGYDHARRTLSMYRRGLLPKNYNRLRRKMIAEIAHKIDRINRKKGIHAEGEALTRVLAEGKASRFFISPQSALRIIYKH